MADLNDDDSVPPTLTNDLLIEIIARSSLKKVMQCSVLNKSLCHRISQTQFKRLRSSRATTIFRCSAFNPKIFTRFPGEIMSSPSSAANTTSPSYSGLPSVTLERETSVLASCDGLLLLRINKQQLYHVFNPFTGGIMPFESRCRVFTSIGIAVDVAGSPFNLVAADLTEEPDRTVVKFDVFAPGPDGRSMRLKSKAVFTARRRFTLEADDNIRPVYAAGSLYWLGDNGRITLAFDVENRQGRISDGPLANRPDRTGDKWFGPASGSVRFVHATQKEIVIYSHDRASGVWRVDHLIGNISNAGHNDYRYGQLVYFDGNRLFFLLRHYGGNGNLHIYNVLTEKWEERLVFSGWYWIDSRQHFFSFMLTTAKVSDFYLKDLKEIEEEEMRKRNKLYDNIMEANQKHAGFHDTLLGLHRLLSPTAD